MTRSPDVLDRLSAANPVDATAPIPPAELARIEAGIRAARVVPPARRRVPRLILAGAAAALAAAAAVLIVTLPGAGVAPARAAYAAFAARTGVFHTVAEVTVRQPGRRATHAWVESWTSARGGRSHVLQYDVRPDGRRGRLVAETVGHEIVAYARPRDGGPVGLAGIDASGGLDPRLAYLQAFRDGRVRDEGTVTVRGRRAWRLVSDLRMPPSLNQIDGRRIRVPGYVAHRVFLVDARTRALLVARDTGLIGTERGYHRQTVVRTYLRFERVDSGAGLRPTRRF